MAAAVQMCGAIDERRRVQPAYIAVRVAGKLLFRYDPQRRIVEVQERGERHYIDLAALDEQAQGIDKNVSS
jgi:hypothetical protein